MAKYTRLVPEAPPAWRRPYPSDLTAAQWALLEPLRQERDRAGPGRPASVDFALDRQRALVHETYPFRYLGLKNRSTSTTAC